MAKYKIGEMLVIMTGGVVLAMIANAMGSPGTFGLPEVMMQIGFIGGWLLRSR